MFPHLATVGGPLCGQGATEPREITSTYPFHGFLCALILPVVISRDVVALCLQGGLYSTPSPSHCISYIVFIEFCTVSIVALLPGFHAYGDWEVVAHVVFSFLNTTVWFCLNGRVWRVPPLHNGPGETSPVISLCPVIGDGMFPQLFRV